MRFLYIAITYPNVTKNKNMYTYLMHELVNLGHEVSVIAPTFDSSTEVNIEGEIPVLRVKTGPLFYTQLIAKGINTLLLNSRYKRAFFQYWKEKKIDWILTSTPPITLSPFIQDLKNRYQAKLYLILRDIFPQNAKDIGLIKDPFLFAYFRHKERHLYKISDLIGCMSPGNISYLKRHNPQICNDDKLKYFPNWIKPGSLKNQVESQNTLHRKFNLEGEFIALFGGNFGKPQKVEFVLDLADRVKHLKDVVFCMIGSGTEKKRIQEIVKRKALENVLIIERLPREEYQQMIRDADIGLVNLSEKFTIPNIPSRTLGYWDASLPVLAATDGNTDLNKNFLKKYNAGLWSETGDIDGYYTRFMRFYENSELRKAMGQNGRRAVETEFSVHTAAKRLMDQIEEG
ncbi:MAG: glycosyltransferase family 4 protein [Petrotogales bacterium]